MEQQGLLISRLGQVKKSYPNTLQRLAKHFYYAGVSGNVLDFADELEKKTDIEVVCITDEEQRPIGIIRKDKIFLLLSKRFGRDVMAKSIVKECMEEPRVFPGESNILLIQEQLRREDQGYIVLVDSGGIFTGILSLQDIADYMVEMTNDDIALASLLQERFLANTGELGSFGTHIDTWWASAKGVGGDFYFIKKITENQFFASLCDVSGKGIAASLVVSMVWGFLKGHALKKGLRDLLTSLNESIVSSFHLEKYLTGFFMIYDSQTRLLYIADMGHAHTVFLRRGQILSLKKTQGNLPIGVETEIKPLIYSFPVQKGDTLLIYSDGVPEQDNPEGEEFGEQRIITLTKQAAENGQLLSEILPHALEEFRKHTPQRDDMTFLQFRF